MNYRNEIDGIRAIAVISVILAHAGFAQLSGGFVGVDVFFVISGYLIFGIIQRDLEQEKFNFGQFYARRARRILPALFLVVGVSFAVGWMMMSPSQIVDLALGGGSAVLFIANVYFWDITGYFSPNALTQPLLHTWSLSVEEQYYLLFPVVIATIWRFLGRRAAIGGIILLALASLALAEWGWRNKPQVNYFFSASRFWEMLFGASCVLVERRRKGLSSDPLAFLGLAMIACAVLFYGDTTPFPSVYALLPVGGTALLLLFARNGTRCAKILTAPPLMLIGLISYSAYLWHQPVFAFSRLIGVGDTSGWVAIPLILLILGLSVASWKLVEQPLRNGQGQFGLSTSGLAVLTTVSFVGLVGAALIGGKTNIAAQAYPAKDQPLVKLTRRAAKTYLSEWPNTWIRRPFADNGKRKFLIVGDSFAKDILNGLNETGIADHLDISFQIISSNCGNVFLKPGTTGFPPKDLHPDCKGVERYGTAAVRQLMAGADTIVLASRWDNWVIPFLPMTLQNLSDTTNAEIVLLGTKRYPQIDYPALIGMAPGERPAAQFPIDGNNSRINIAMRELAMVEFVDVQFLLCPNENVCPVIAPNGTPLSIDENHVSPAGAVDFIEKLVAGSPRFSRALGISN